ncbi:MAG: FAD:protein FMN transferase, partial [Chloroflexi bacterium]|nr:FAD:protein FMN transferase [Chloroflexota bacterium]
RSQSAVVMDTIVTVKAISDRPAQEVMGAMERSLGWFREVERVCSRFDPSTEVFRLAPRAGEAVAVSPLLFEAVRFSREVAALSHGAFDPTIGAAQARRGFDRNYVTGEHIGAPNELGEVSYLDIVVDEERRTVTLRKPLLLDLGAVVKGMAIDLAARELASLGSFSIDAGGDVYVSGRNAEGGPWRIGIQHPRADGLIATVALDHGAVCTSGDYARPAVGTPGEHHLLDPRGGRSAKAIVSCTVVAETAMVADALSTAAFVAGPEDGLRLLEDQGVDGMLVDADLNISMTNQFQRWMA